jgi:hypothetical protein
MSTSATAASMSRDPSDYTANNEIRSLIHSNPIPSEMIGKCIERGTFERRSSKNSMNITLRYEQGPEFIELTINLQANKVFAMDSSYLRDEPQIGE